MRNNIVLFYKKYTREIILVLAIVVYIIYFTAASFLRYTNFYTGRFDLGNMDQTVWNTVHGRIFQLTNPDGTNIISRLAFHADFILILLAPFYLLWQDPRMLLLIQTLLCATGAVFVYLLAKKIIKQKTIALILALSFLLNPNLQYANLYDFHAVTLATTFFLMAFYFLQNKKYVLYCSFLLLAALTKEQVWLVTSLFGLYTFFISKKRLFGLGIFIASVLCFYIIFNKAIPMARGGEHFALSYYSDFGASPKDIVRNIFLSPQKTVPLLVGPNRLLYIYEVFSPIGFLAFFAPLLLIFTIPDFGINLLSNNSQLHQIYYQYTAVILPFTYIATIYAIPVIRKLFPTITFKKISIFLLCSVLLSAGIFGPLPFTRDPSTAMFTKPLPYAQSVDAFLSTIPIQYSVAATNNIGSHMSHRQKIFTIPTGIDQADIVVFLLTDKYAQPTLAAQRQMVEKLHNNKQYVELFRYNDFAAFKKRGIKLAP